MAIDLDALRADVQIAQQTGRKMCSIHVDELMSLLSRADVLAKVQEFIPFRIGYCCPEDVHRMVQGEIYKCGIRIRKGKNYNIEVLVRHLPKAREKPVDGLAECGQSAT